MSISSSGGGGGGRSRRANCPGAVRRWPATRRHRKLSRPPLLIDSRDVWWRRAELPGRLDRPGCVGLGGACGTILPEESGGVWQRV